MAQIDRDQEMRTVSKYELESRSGTGQLRDAGGSKSVCYRRGKDECALCDGDDYCGDNKSKSIKSVTKSQLHSSARARSQNAFEK